MPPLSFLKSCRVAQSSAQHIQNGSKQHRPRTGPHIPNEPRTHRPRSGLGTQTGSRKQSSKLLDLVSQAANEIDIPFNNLASLLQECADRLDFQLGRELHHIILSNFLDSNAYLGSFSVRMYGSFRCLREAKHAFGRISQPNLYSWSAIISAHTNLGQGQQAIRLFYCMQISNVKADAHVFVGALKACSCPDALRHGKLIHHHILENDIKLDGFIGSALTELYVKHGNLTDGCSVFSALRRPDVVTWDIMITGFVQQGYSQEALWVHTEMLYNEIEPDRVSFLCILKACLSMASLDYVRLIHHHILEFSAEGDGNLGNALVATYAKCSGLVDAKEVFQGLPNHDVVTWGAMIEGCSQHGRGQDALQLFNQMQHEGLELDRVASLSILKACSMLAALDSGKRTHACIIESGFGGDLLVGSSLIDMYARCGALVDAFKVFQSIPHPNVVTWNAMITGHIHRGQGPEAVHLFHQMLQQGLEPNQVTFVCIMKVCSDCLSLDLGKLIHMLVIESGSEYNVSVGNTLIDMYSRCTCLIDAHKLFEKMPERDTITWSVLMSGYAQNNDLLKGLELVVQMLQGELQPDEALFLSIVKVCSNTKDFGLTRLAHAQIIESGIDCHMSLGNTLLDTYGKCEIEDAWIVFEALSERDLVTYNSMIAACVYFDQLLKCFQLLEQMRKVRIEPNEITYTSILGACAGIAGLDEGRVFHGHIIEMNLDCNIFVVNSLIDMYGKCGSLESARRVFDRWPRRDIVTWNAIIAGCAHHSESRLALDYFKSMRHAGVKPDQVTFVSLLSACSHAGFIEEGNSLFRLMKKEYSITPTIDHFNCMVDLFGRVGCLKEASDFLDSTPFETNIVGWTSLLSHCKMNGNVELGQVCFDRFVEVDGSNAAAYVLMSHNYSSVGLQGDALLMEDMRRDSFAWKKPGKALIHIGNKVHAFVVRELTASSGDIDAKMKRLSTETKDEGYMPSLCL